MPVRRPHLGPPRSLTNVTVASAVAFALAAFLPGPADAHFILQAPASWKSQDGFGSPQKLGPCGDENGGTPTGKVTLLQAGQTITVMIDEKIFHPGHYRVALAVNDRSELPPEPIVTPGSTACGSVPIMDPPVFPVLADGMLPHTKAFSGPQSFQVTLPSDVTCDHCTLQVIEFMSQHPLNNPGGCFYHHCADIAIQGATGPGAGGAAGAVGAGGAGGTGVGAAGTAGPGGSGTSGSGGSGAGGGASGATATAGGAGATSGDAAAPASSGCGCTVAPAKTPTTLLGAATFLVLALARRRRRS